MSIGEQDFSTGMKTATSSTYISGYPELENLGQDPYDCDHEWWQQNSVVYTTHPAKLKQQCRLCGKVRYVEVNPIQPIVNPWIKVKKPEPTLDDILDDLNEATNYDDPRSVESAIRIRHAIERMMG